MGYATNMNRDSWSACFGLHFSICTPAVTLCPMQNGQAPHWSGKDNDALPVTVTGTADWLTG